MEKPSKSYYLFDPCKTCALREFCGDECGRLEHPTDVKKSPVGPWVPKKKATQIKLIPISNEKS